MPTTPKTRAHHATAAVVKAEPFHFEDALDREVDKPQANLKTTSNAI